MASAWTNHSIISATSSSRFGYHYGPIPNNNPDWFPPRQAAAIAAGTRPPTITPVDNAHPPNAAVRLSTVNGNVCMIEMHAGSGVMCGVIVSTQPGLRRHIRTFHPGAVINPTRRQTTPAEEYAGMRALKKFVLSGQWRDAQFVREPGCGPIGGPLNMYATALEEIAAHDAAFAARWGARFHRRVR